MGNLKFYFFLSILFLTACQKENTEFKTPELDDLLTIEVLKDYLPSEYFGSIELVFFDEDFNERKLISSMSETVQERTVNGSTYNIENLEIEISDENDPNFKILLIGSTNYTSNYDILTYFFLDFMLGHTNGGTGGSINFVDGKPQQTAFRDFHEEIELHSKVFRNVDRFVGKNVFQEQADAFSEILFSSESGFVGFRDEENRLWVLDRIIK